MATTSLSDTRVTAVLRRIAERAADDDAAVEAAQKRLRGHVERPSEGELCTAFADAALPVSAATGRLLYALVLTARCHTVVEVGTSHGAAAVHIAAALKDNGGGLLHSFEIDEKKSEQARENLAAAGLGDYVAVYEEDALTGMRPRIGEPVDLLFLDSWQDRYRQLLVAAEPLLRRGALVVADDTHPVGARDYLVHVDSGGYLPVITPSDTGVAVSLWLGRSAVPA